MATLDITIRMIRTTLENQSETGVIDSNHRGRKVGKSILNDSLTQSVKDHINSILQIESHYFRAQSTREFIKGEKTLTQLYRDYKALSESNNKLFVKESMYRPDRCIFLILSLIFPSLHPKSISVRNASQTKISRKVMKMSNMIQ